MFHETIIAVASCEMCGKTTEKTAENCRPSSLLEGEGWSIDRKNALSFCPECKLMTTEIGLFYPWASLTPLAEDPTRATLVTREGNPVPLMLRGMKWRVDHKKTDFALSSIKVGVTPYGVAAAILEAAFVTRGAARSEAIGMSTEGMTEEIRMYYREVFDRLPKEEEA